MTGFRVNAHLVYKSLFPPPAILKKKRLYTEEADVAQRKGLEFYG